MVEVNRFNIRVYGLLINEHDEILLVKEKINDYHFTKFPGGGLEFGEGIKECLIREFKEETGLDIVVIDHFYTTDFFQQSAFKKTDQLISIYYKVKSIQPSSTIRLDEFEVKDNSGSIEQLQFLWIKLEALKEHILTFPIDKEVCNQLLQLP